MWSKIPPNTQYVVTDSAGRKYAFNQKPSFNGKSWIALQSRSEPIFLGICELGNKPASDTLLSRNEHVINGLSLLLNYLITLKSSNQVDEYGLDICRALIRDVSGIEYLLNMGDDKK